MKGLAVGQKASIERIFTMKDFVDYKTLTGDVSLGFSESGPAEERRATVPGPLLGGLFSNLLGTRLPGRGTNWLKQKLAFQAAVFLGEPITAEVEIVRLRPEKNLVNLRTTCKKNSGEIVCDGEALVLVRDLEMSGS